MSQKLPFGLILAFALLLLRQAVASSRTSCPFQLACHAAPSQQVKQAKQQLLRLFFVLPAPYRDLGDFSSPTGKLDMGDVSIQVLKTFSGEKKRKPHSV